MNIRHVTSEDGTEHFHIDPAISLEEKKSAGVLLIYTPERQRGRTMSISGIASGFYYVHHETLIGDLVEDLNTRESVLAIGMVGDNREALGVITRRELFNLLGRSFGEEAARDMPVSKISRKTGVYPEDANTISISEQIADEMKKPTLRFFLISDAEGKFAGIFSTRDIMTHLAAITRKDLETAGVIQSRIVPETTYQQKGKVEVCAATQMAMGVGGDFYSIKNYKQGNWFFITADVSGKGMAASLLTSIAGGLIHMHNFSAGVRDLVKKFNSYIHTTFNSEKFITAVFMTLDEENEYLRVYDMGHSMLYLIRKKRLHNIRGGKSNLPLGIMSDIEPVSARVKLEPGDFILLVTDGVTEQCNTEREEYGIERCAEIIKHNSGKTLDHLISALKEDINNFRGTEQQYDDITYMLLRYG